MNIRIKTLLIGLAILSATTTLYSNPKDPKSEIEAMNNTIERLYQSEDIPRLLELYTDDLTFFPEFKPAIFDREKLKDFYTQWFKQSEIKSYKKKIYEVRSISNHVVEIGAMEVHYSAPAQANGRYQGTYMIVWERDKADNLKMMSEAFGADEYFEPAKVPYTHVEIQSTNFVGKHTVSRELLSEIEDFNAAVIKAVAEGDSDTRAKGFTEDGICKPPFAPLKVGMAQLADHMKRTYRPGTSFRVKHTYYRIYDLGEFVFINGHYVGEWGDSTNGGKFGGNMTNLMKRTDDGKLLMYRQLGNREF